MERSGLGDNLSASNVNSIFDDFDHAYLDNTTVIYADKTTVGGSHYMKNGILQKRGIASFFGRINYDYKGNLFVDPGHACRWFIEFC